MLAFVGMTFFSALAALPGAALIFCGFRAALPASRSSS
jgi:hypothetical protein